TGGNRAKPPQARKARRPTTADRTSVLCITSAEFGGSGGPSLTSERMAGNYWNTFAPGATHLSSPTSATKSARSRHQQAMRRDLRTIAMASPASARLATQLHAVGQYGWTSVQRDFDDCRPNLRLMGSWVAYLGGHDVESANCRSDRTLRLHF